MKQPWTIYAVRAAAVALLAVMCFIVYRDATASEILLSTVGVIGIGGTLTLIYRLLVRAESQRVQVQEEE